MPRLLSAILILLVGVAVGFLSSPLIGRFLSPAEFTNLAPATAQLQPPAELTNLTPELASTVGRKPTLAWSARGATAYDLYLGITDPLAQVASSTIATSFTPTSPLKANETYHWRVVARNGAGDVPGSVWSFTTTNTLQPTSQPQPQSQPRTQSQPITELTNLTPALASNVRRRPTLTWNAQGATAYDLYLGSADPLPIVANDITGTSFTPTSPLESNVTYYWRVVAKNQYEEIPGSVWSFTTTESPPPQPQARPQPQTRSKSQVFEAASFKVFDETLYYPRRPARYPGFIPISGAYSGSLWSDFSAGHQDVDEHRVRQEAAKFPNGDTVFLDVEHWWPIEANTLKFKRIVDLFHEVNPTLKVGYYGTVPWNAWYPGVTGDPQQFANWRRQTNALELLADAVDFFAPNLYHMEGCSMEDWVKHATANMAETKYARSLGDLNRPIYPFLIMTFQGGDAPCDDREFTYDEWMLQLSTLKKLGADGVIIWGTPTGKDSWNESAPWWRATKDFIDAQRHLPPQTAQRTLTVN